jgi:hypothetical protein
MDIQEETVKIKKMLTNAFIPAARSSLWAGWADEQ